MTVNDLIFQEEPVEPETLYSLGFADSSLDIQRILSMRLVVHTSGPLIDFGIFENVVAALNDVESNTDQLEPSRPEWIWKALDLFNFLRPGFELSTEVKTYIKFIFEDAGCTFYPPLSGLPNPNYLQIKSRAASGETLSDENELDVQAIYYLKIQLYVNGID